MQLVTFVKNEQFGKFFEKMTSSAHRLDDTSKIRTVDVTESTEKRSFSDLHLGPNLTQGMKQFLIFSCVFLGIKDNSRLEKDFNWQMVSFNKR